MNAIKISSTNFDVEWVKYAQSSKVTSPQVKHVAIVNETGWNVPFVAHEIRAIQVCITLYALHTSLRSDTSAVPLSASKGWNSA